MSERKLRSLDTLFSGDDDHSNSGVAELALALLDSYAHHPFKLYNGKRLDDLVESIKENGVMTPIIVRPKPGERYEILSGHNRANASTIAGNKTIPALVKEGLTDSEAKLIVTQTNFFQRSLADMLPSEKAFAFRLELEGLKAERKYQQIIAEIEQLESAENADEQDVSSKVFQLEHLAKSRDGLAQNHNLSSADIQRYIRLTHLCSELLALVDDETIALRAAVPLTHLPEDMQLAVHQVVAETGCKVDIRKADQLKADYKAGKLQINRIREILLEQAKPKKMSKLSVVKLRPAVFSKYFAKAKSHKEIEETITKALELYFSTKEG